MSTAGKGRLWQELKAAGVHPERHYRDYTEAELAAAVTRLRELQKAAAAEAGEDGEPAPVDPAQITVPEFERPEPRVKRTYTRRQQPQQAQPTYDVSPGAFMEPGPPQQFGTPDTMAGLRQNTTAEDEVIRVDENGYEWYQDEVRKPSMPQPRARRVLRYNDTGVETKSVQVGQYTETFEVAGQQTRPGEIKITLPSYQVGIYKDPRFPFKIHVYNEMRGFDLFEVQEFYGGSDLVPMDIKKIYVENVLCYDIRTTVRAIEAEARQIDLMKRLPR